MLLQMMKPADGKNIVDPFHNDWLPPSGRVVDMADFYWFRLAEDGDIVPADDQPTAPQHLEGSDE